MRYQISYCIGSIPVNTHHYCCHRHHRFGSILGYRGKYTHRFGSILGFRFRVNTHHSLLLSSSSSSSIWINIGNRRMEKNLSNSSVRQLCCTLVADADGVGGEAWTCDGQTNGLNFLQFVCPSTLLHVGSGCRWCRR